MDIYRVVPRSGDGGAWPEPPRSSRRLLWIERLLIALAIVALGHYSYVRAEAFLYQHIENRELDRILQAGNVHESTGTANAARPAAGSLVGRIEVPRLEVSAVVFTGSDASTLQRAVGHIPGTPLPGAPGNAGLAGHRDTFFRRLRHIEPGDEVLVTTIDGVYRYRVDETRIVEPTDVWVLDPTSGRTLTLITCYPFTFIGSAPQRFIVRASLPE
jgi:sortase A